MKNFHLMFLISFNPFCFSESPFLPVPIPHASREGQHFQRKTARNHVLYMHNRSPTYCHIQWNTQHNVLHFETKSGVLSPYACVLNNSEDASTENVLPRRLRLKRDGTRWRTRGEVKGKLANGVGSQYPSHYLGTWRIQNYYRWWAHLGCQVVDWTDAPPPDLKGLVRFTGRRNMVSARVPPYFNWPLPTQTATLCSHLHHLKIAGVTIFTVVTENNTERRKGQERHVNKNGNQKKVDERWRNEIDYFPLNLSEPFKPFI